MSSCPAPEVLAQILQGTLPEAEAIPLRAHLMECPHCQAGLDRLSDEPNLPRCASLTPPAAASSGEWNLQGVLRRLRSLAELDTAETGGTDEVAGASLGFLGPAASAGDLGTLGSYRILRELGRGGMWIVLLGFDPTLQRPVALKVLPPERSDARSRERFVREARAAARINHDHVVPVHGVVAPVDGPVYLVMQYVEGPTLRARIRTEERLDPREAARLCLQVAEGLAAAHHLGLAHRDIKPANIILDRATGRARITDFGLVRTTSLAGGTTRDETVPGTPEYMSPEQVREPDRVDARSDLYSLGVTLYEMLTGTVPFRGVPHLVLQQVLSDEPPPPRRLNDRIPCDLETICLKALAKAPGRRYQTAQELADDLGRWLRGEPIRARRIGLAGKGWRWCRRRPALASLTAALVLVVIGSLAGLTWLWRLAEDQRRIAEANLADARRAVRQHYTILSTVRLNQEAGTQELQKQLLETALEYYRGFLQRHRDDPAVRAEVAEAHFNVGRIVLQIGSQEEALSAFQQARTLLVALVAGDPAQAAWQTSLGETYLHIGKLKLRTGRSDEARGWFEKARDLWAHRCQVSPHAPGPQSHLAASYHALAELDAATGRPAEALRSYRRARDLGEAVLRSEPANAKFQFDLATIYNNLGKFQLTHGSPADAAASYRRANELWVSLRQIDPQSVRVQSGLAATGINLGLAHRAQGNLSEALTALEGACNLLEQLVRGNPTVTDFRAQLASAYHNLAVVHRQLGQEPKVLPSFQQACNLLAELVRTHPSDTEFRFRLGQTAIYVGLLQDKLGHPAEALASFRQACGALDQLVPADRQDIRFQVRLAEAHWRGGDLHRRTGAPEEALRSAQRARLLLEALVRAHPTPEVRQDLARVHLLLANVFKETGRPAEARRSLDEAQELLDNLMRAGPAATDAQGLRALAFHFQGNLHQQAQQPDPARASYRRAADLLEKLVATDGIDPHFRRYHQGLLIQVYLDQEALERETGQLAAARACGEQAHRLSVTLTEADPAAVAYEQLRGLACGGLGKVEVASGRPEKALPWFQQALGHHRAVLAKAPQMVAYRQALADDLAGWAALQRALGRPAEAVAATLERRDLWPDDPNQLGEVARDLARAIPVVGQGQPALAAADQALRRQYADQAMAVLEQALAHGFRDVVRLKQPDFDPLRAREDFRQFLARVEGATGAGRAKRP